MSEEEKYINQLFEAAKNEAPKRSFEEVATHFEKTIITTPVATGWSKLYVKYFSLNTFLLTVIGGLGIAGFLWLMPTPVAQTTTLTAKKAIPINQEEKSQIIQQPSNNNLVKKEVQPKAIIIPKEKSAVEVNLMNKKVPPKEVLSVTPSQQISKFIPNTITKAISEKAINLTTSVAPNAKEIAAVTTTSAKASVATIDSLTPMPTKIKTPNKKSE